MKNTDFSACPFIKEKLCFLTYNDFCNNAKIIKELYEALTKEAKTFYKWYLYANIHMSEFFKDKIWDYLNNPDPEYYETLMDSIRKYRVR